MESRDYLKRPVFVIPYDEGSVVVRDTGERFLVAGYLQRDYGGLIPNSELRALPERDKEKISGLLKRIDEKKEIDFLK